MQPGLGLQCPAHPNSIWWGIITLLLPDCCAPHHREEPGSLKTKQTKPHLLDGLKKCLGSRSAIVCPQACWKPSWAPRAEQGWCLQLCPFPGAACSPRGAAEQAFRYRPSAKSVPGLWLHSGSAVRASTCLPAAPWARTEPGCWVWVPSCSPAGREGCVCGTQPSDGQERHALLAHAGGQLPAQPRSMGRVRRGQQDTGEPVPVGRES